MNLARRDLTVSQRGLIAAEMANMKHGGDRKPDQGGVLPLDISAAKAAKHMHVSESTVDRGRRKLVASIH